MRDKKTVTQIEKLSDMKTYKSKIQKEPVKLREKDLANENLTTDEIQKLEQAECRYPVLKRAILFSFLTGLGKSDIERLTWKDVHKFNKYTRIIFKQKKTGGQEYLDITSQENYLLWT